MRCIIMPMWAGGIPRAFAVPIVWHSSGLHLIIYVLFMETLVCAYILYT
jgi:hypothetical protein